MPNTCNQVATDVADKRPRAVIFALALVLSAVASAWCIRWADYSMFANGEAKVVLIENMRFVPRTVDLRLGDRIVFKNRGLEPCAVILSGDDPFESGMLAHNQEWSFIPSRRGTFYYHLTGYPSAEGCMRVKNR